MQSPSNHRGDDDLLYGDLEDAAIANPSSSSNYIALTMTELEIEQLREQLQSLKSENFILKQNMGILYRTAKSELDRKDRTILELQSELDSLRR
jgi:ribosomal protein L19E